MEICVWNYSVNVLSELKDRLLPIVQKDKRERILQTSHPLVVIQRLAGDLLLRYILMDRFGLSSTECYFVMNPFGKPYLRERGDLHFNLSHSGSWIACAVDVKSVGIDVECIRPLNIDGISSFFSEQERDWLGGIPLEHRLDAFFELWTSKESFLKAVGKGLSIPLRSFSVIPNSSQASKVISASTEEPDYWIRNYPIAPEIKLAVCTQHPGLPFITYTQLDQVMDSLKKAYHLF